MGRIKLLNESAPLDGSHPSFSANSRMDKRPSQKAGMDEKNMAVTELITSRAEYCFTADKIPRGTPMATDKSMAPAASFIVVGNLENISVNTGVLVR